MYWEYGKSGWKPEFQHLFSNRLGRESALKINLAEKRVPALQFSRGPLESFQ